MLSPSNASDRLKSALLMHHHTLEVDLEDLARFNPELAQRYQKTPGDMSPLVRTTTGIADISSKQRSCAPRVRS